MQDAPNIQARWRDYYNQQRPHSSLAHRTPTALARDHEVAVERFATINASTANFESRQGSLRRQRSPPLTRSSLAGKSPLSGKALIRIAHTRDSLLSIWSELQARESSSGEP
ncbi:MAG: integrase core domain-containing protein [Candidatus Dormibacteraceae bacterium]